MAKSCSDIYDEYGGQSPSTAGWYGAGQAALGVIGVGQFEGDPVDQSALDDIQADYKNLQNKWQSVLEANKEKLTAEEQNYYQRQINLLQTVNDFSLEMMDEKIGRNSLLISVIVAFLTIIIIYLIIL